MGDLWREGAQLVQRYNVLRQQQMTFVSALDNSRPDVYERCKPLKSIAEVKELHRRCKNSRDKRALGQWLDLVGSLEALRQRAEVQGSLSKEGPIGRAMQRWKTLSNPNHDFSGLQAKYPHTEVNHLSCEEARIRYGGCVSLLPFIFDQITRIQSEMAKRSSSLDLDKTWPPATPHPKARLVRSAAHQRSKTENHVPVRASSAMGARDKAVDTKDLSRRMLRLSFGRLPKGTDEPVLYFRRTLNGRADQLHINGGEVATLNRAPWRGASCNKVNHVDHRRFINVENEYF